MFQNIFSENLTTVFKSPYIAKSEKLFWFLTTLIAFVIAYIFSIIQTGFLWLTRVFTSNLFIYKDIRKTTLEI